MTQLDFTLFKTTDISSPNKAFKLFWFFSLFLVLSSGLFSCRSTRTSHSSRRPAPKAYASKPRSSASSTKVEAKQVDQVIRTARSYMGTRYKYAGTTRSGMDCSGLVFTSFKAIDVTLPRSSYEQAEIGSKVKLSQVQPGDLVFFSEKKGGQKVSHVGLVTEVKSDDKVIFIHATNSKGVMEDNLFSEYYQKIFIKAVRPFDN